MADDSTSISWESMYKISHIWVGMLTFYILLFGAMYLAWCDFTMDPTKEQQLCIAFCANLKTSATETLSMNAYEHSGKKAWVVHGKSKLTEIKNGETDEEQSQKHVHYFLWHQGDCLQRIHPGRPNSQFCVLLWCFMVTMWKCAKTKELALASRQHTVSHFSFHQVDQKQQDCHPPPTLLLSVSPIEDTSESLPFWHNWCDQGRITSGAEHSQNMTYMMYLKNGTSVGNGAYARKKAISRVMMASRSKVSFWPEGSTSPGNYGWIFF
jgi:hypothetical protein